MGRLRSAVVVAAMLSLLGAESAHAALSNDGTVTVEYSGTFDQSFVYQPSNPADWQGALHFMWDEKETVALSGREQQRPTIKVLSRSLTITGKETNTFAPPNTAMSCTGEFSPRAGAPNPIIIGYDTELHIVAIRPTSTNYIRSSAPPGSHCGDGGLGWNAPASTQDDMAKAQGPGVNLTLPSNPYSKTFTANGSDANVTQSFQSLFEVTTNGKTTGPGKPKLTPAQVKAKFNALNALKQSAGGALYPCALVYLGTTLTAAGPVGIAAAGMLIGSAQGMCVSYYVTVLSEARTVGDPPRADYGRVAAGGRTPAAGRSLPSCGQWRGAILGACQRARSAAAKLLAAAGDTANAARAIEITIAREKRRATGPQPSRRRTSRRRPEPLVSPIRGTTPC